MGIEKIAIKAFKLIERGAAKAPLKPVNWLNSAEKINIRELSFAPKMKGEILNFSGKKVKLEEKDFDWLYWKHRPGTLPTVSKPIDYSDDAKRVTDEFIKKNRVKDKLPDGFRMTSSHFEDGFDSKGNPILDFDFFEKGAAGEFMYIDRRTDKGLNTTIKKFKELFKKNENLSEESKVDLLMQFVNGCYTNSRNHWTELFPLDMIALGQTVKHGSGMCRHRALLTKVLADEVGLNTSMVRGCYNTGKNSIDCHMWNEFTNKKGERYLLDTILHNFKKISSNDAALEKYMATQSDLYKQLYT